MLIGTCLWTKRFPSLWTEDKGKCACPVTEQWHWNVKYLKWWESKKLQKRSCSDCILFQPSSVADPGCGLNKRMYLTVFHSMRARIAPTQTRVGPHRQKGNQSSVFLPQISGTHVFHIGTTTDKRSWKCLQTKTNRCETEKRKANTATQINQQSSINRPTGKCTSFLQENEDAEKHPDVIRNLQRKS